MKCPKCKSEMTELKIWDDDGFTTIVHICEKCGYKTTLQKVEA